MGLSPWLIAGAAGTSIFGNLLGGILGNSAAGTAADQQTSAGERAIDFWKQTTGQQQGNQQPFLSAGQQSIGQLMGLLSSGKFGAGSTGEVPQYTGSFKPPTLEDARSSPGYQFTAQQGNKGVLQGAAAAGGAISGGTLRALDTFNTGLADNTYGNVFNRSLQTYNTGLQDYAAKLQGYGAGLLGKQQEFNEQAFPAQLGENAATSLNANLGQGAANVGDLMTQIGNAQAAGTIGGANSKVGAIKGIAQSLLQALALSNSSNSQGSSGGGGNGSLFGGGSKTGPG